MKRPFSPRDHLPSAIYSVAGVRELDRRIIERMGDNGFELMSHAAEAAFALLLSRWPDAEHICVFAGPGNNGGDAWVLASLAALHKIRVSFYTLGDMSRQSGSAAEARSAALQVGIKPQPFTGELAFDGDLIVDGLLGTGLNAPVRDDYARAIAAINQHPADVLSLDIPSGLHADTGVIMGSAVQATQTVTFIAMKAGLLTADGPDVSGDLSCAALDLIKDDKNAVAPVMERISWYRLEQQKRRLPARRGNSHKGSYGHALLIGGEHGAGGAIAMAAEACARTGAGKISCATRAMHVPVILNRRPEVMVHAVESGLQLTPLLDQVTAIGCGPGLGQKSWAELLLQPVLSACLPMVLDADALNNYALNLYSSAGWHDDFSQREVVLTPHPGEAARLLRISTDEVQSDRPAAARKLAEQCRAVVVLKGQGSLIASPDGRMALCTDGNPGMASGGMGDILTGVITALLAQGLDAWQAACLGVCVHSAAADMAAAEHGQHGLLATDLLPWIRELMN
ncbi:MAG TPA: bifunctional ADP-dependent NAD(P)H-hydrate dehydratase/NAD(P)H-hydrate epimerase [Oceanospirillales bacterium]|nr:bifunctional ADP-dependent NAD(P)H-hydrate dehydratase/NAD(P)H-hydrate epimerase [Oceanospirillaceae bacterium]HBS42578.1 bifunctional ADP-dependent NAD(P)H-hydrate dehydratase/NAD(P)H-hydrate epimerase [Oceanospirillales bacterium]|tara:strand:+ start:16036 stop:17571 length:1536 start_codon:yes stop_codon:yes gene_type:complete